MVLKAKTAKSLSFAAILLFGTVLAQAGTVGPNVTRTYDIRELTVRPALIYISTSYLTLLEFEDLVVRVASAKGDVLSAQLKDNYVYLIAQVPQGSTDLLVTVADGRVAMFRVQVDKNATGPRRYVIRFPTPQGEPSVTSPTPPPTPRTEVRDERGSPVIPSPTPSLPPPERPTPTPGQPVEGLPPYIQVRAVPLWDSGLLSLNLTVRNGGSRSLVADPGSVRVYGLSKGGDRIVLPVKVSGGGRVAPRGAATLALVTEVDEGARKEGVEVVWRITEVGTATIWTYRVVLREGE